jgi:uncharacterized protein YbcV (DUF1398 family)
LGFALFFAFLQFTSFSYYIYYIVDGNGKMAYIAGNIVPGLHPLLPIRF